MAHVRRFCFAYSRVLRPPIQRPWGQHWNAGRAAPPLGAAFLVIVIGLLPGSLRRRAISTQLQLFWFELDQWPLFFNHHASRSDGHCAERGAYYVLSVLAHLLAARDEG